MLSELHPPDTGPVGGRFALAEEQTFRKFLEAAREEYTNCTPQAPPAHFAVLVGRLSADIVIIERVERAGNVRATAAESIAEFEEVIVPCFGKPYANSRRGYWCDAGDLLRIATAAEQEGLEVLGSVHLHPDWHRIGPPAERGMVISECPTPMDQHMFRQTGWPLNIICYLDTRDGVIHHTWAAWAPRQSGSFGHDYVSLPLRFMAGTRLAKPLPGHRRAPDGSSDEAEIRLLATRMMDAWREGNGEQFASVFADDADFTSIRADQVGGRIQIAAAHTRLLSTVYHGTRLCADVRNLRRLQPDIAVVNIGFRLVNPDGRPVGGPDGGPPGTMHALAVLERRATGWVIVSFQNMVPIQQMVSMHPPTDGQAADRPVE